MYEDILTEKNIAVIALTVIAVVAMFTLEASPETIVVGAISGISGLITGHVLGQRQ